MPVPARPRAGVRRRTALLGLLTLSAALLSGPAADARGLAQPAPGPTSPPAPEVLPPSAPDAGTAPTPTGLAAVLAPLLKDKALGKSFGLEVTDAATGEPLFSRNGSIAYTPASVT
jgi:D-alanyl-D-alanine carboxypeptidase/D-alanyl-D-alanine-endopeptidase (penicillin-binding protein 4)